MDHLSLVRVSALEPFVGILRAAGLPSRPHFEHAAIPEELLGQPESLILKRQFYRFLDSIAQGAGMADAGLRAGEDLTVDNLGPAGAMIRRAPTLRDACHVFAAFLARFVEGNQIWIEEPGDGTAWLLNSVSDGPAPGKEIADHGAIPMLTSLIRLVSGDRWYPEMIQLQTGPAHEAFANSPYSEAAILYRSPATGIRFPARLLSLPPRAMTDNESASLPENLPRSTGERVEGLLASHLRVGFALTLDQTSELIGTTPRTLRRHLADEGLNYRRSMERSRFRIARELLEDRDLKIDSIARHLGYSGANNFTRAFSRISGVTPGQFRDFEPHQS